jgi:cytidylate kinase
MKKIKIAIDGPAASGKSTTAKLLAQKLNYIYIDTGAMYRAATYAVIREKINIFKEEEVKQCILKNEISIQLKNGEQHTFLNAQDVSAFIRSPEINKVISQISSYAEVRAMMVEKQRKLAQQGAVVMDGRDIGTVVLKDAELKVFMTASIEERAKRRLKDLKRIGHRGSYEKVKADIAERDRIDSTRSVAPLKKAKDAIKLDTSQLSIEEQVEKIYEMAIMIR